MEEKCYSSFCKKLEGGGITYLDYVRAIERYVCSECLMWGIGAEIERARSIIKNNGGNRNGKKRSS